MKMAISFSCSKCFPPLWNSGSLPVKCTLPQHYSLQPQSSFIILKIPPASPADPGSNLRTSDRSYRSSKQNPANNRINIINIIQVIMIIKVTLLFVFGKEDPQWFLQRPRVEPPFASGHLIDHVDVSYYNHDGI